MVRRHSRKRYALPLYHYSCVHGADGIMRDGGFIKPHPQPFLNGAKVAWFTTLADPDRVGLGLTSQYLKCDRSRYRFIVADHPTFVLRIRPFQEWIRTVDVDPVVMSALTFPGTRPATWYVATEPIKAMLAPWG